jgi:bidirectional [NiFe] hydrogenase diaphorase subunit
VSATPTRATPAPSWTAACSRATRTPCSKAWRSPPTPSAPARASSTSAPNTQGLAIQRLRAPSARREQGLLGQACSAVPSRFRRRQVRIGAGAFVCGEETALIASIEGKRGSRARGRPTRPSAASGACPRHQQRRDLRQRPAPIIRHGGAWFAAIGTEPARAPRSSPWPARSATPASSRCRWAPRCARSSTRSAAASPTAANSRRPDRRPLGGCIPAHLDLPVDYESLSGVGSIMGSGGLIVMDDHQHGGRGALLHGVLHGRVVRQVHPLPHRNGADAWPPRASFCAGEAGEPTSRCSRSCADLVRETSLCGLGQTAPNPVLSTLRFFRGARAALAPRRRGSGGGRRDGAEHGASSR